MWIGKASKRFFPFEALQLIFLIHRVSIFEQETNFHYVVIFNLKMDVVS
jgi:hypothetical protein